MPKATSGPLRVHSGLHLSWNAASSVDVSSHVGCKEATVTCSSPRAEQVAAPQGLLWVGIDSALEHAESQTQ